MGDMSFQGIPVCRDCNRKAEISAALGSYPPSTYELVCPGCGAILEERPLDLAPARNPIPTPEDDLKMTRSQHLKWKRITSRMQIGRNSKLYNFYAPPQLAELTKSDVII